MRDTPKARAVWREVLTEKLSEHLPSVYHDADKAQRLFMRVAFSGTLRERELAVSEINRLQPVGFKLPPEINTEEEAEVGNWRASLPSNYLKASDFERPALLTIRGFGEEKIGDESRPCVYFDGEPKGLILNITNGTTIEEIAGTPDPDKWPGVRVVAYKTQTDFKGSRVDCIRLRAPKKGAKLPEPEPEEFTADDNDVPF